MANYSLPVITNVACRDGDPFSTCQHKFARLHGISWRFSAPYEDGCEDRIVLKNQLGHFTLVNRHLDGRTGYLDFSAAPYPAGKCKLMHQSSAAGVRRASVVIWVEGERIDVESI